MADNCSNDGARDEAEDPPLSLPHKGGEGIDAPAAAHAEPSCMIVPGNNRKMQKRRQGKRKLFTAALKEAFLEALSCNANIAASAEAVGISEGCVYAHRRSDPEFREGFWLALEQSVAKLVALRLQRALERASGLGTGEGPSTSLRTGGDGGLAPPLALRLDGPPDEKQILDLVKLMQALRDLCRNLSAGTLPAGRPRHAELDEVCAALAKRLKAFPPSAEGSAEELEPGAAGQATDPA